MTTSELSSSLRLAVSELHKALRVHISPASIYSMTEIQTISLLNRSAALLPTELAARTHVKTQSMSQILNKLEANGIIKRKPSREDKRKVYISITAAGKRMVEQTRYERDEWLKGLIERSLSTKEKELLIKALPVLAKLAETK